MPRILIVGSSSFCSGAVRRILLSQPTGRNRVRKWPNLRVPSILLEWGISIHVYIAKCHTNRSKVGLRQIFLYKDGHTIYYRVCLVSFSPCITDPMINTVLTKTTLSYLKHSQRSEYIFTILKRSREEGQSKFSLNRVVSYLKPYYCSKMPSALNSLSRVDLP